MRMNENVRLIGILVLAMLVLASVQVVSAETAQSWHLLGEDHEYKGTAAADGTDHLIDCNMSKTLTSSKTSKTLAHTETMWWYAEYPAQCDLTFPAGGDWIVRIDHEKKSGWNWYAGVYKVDSDGTAISFASGTAPVSNTESGVTTITCHQSAAQTFNIASGDRLALRIKHDNSTGEVTTYFYKGTHLSNLTSPSSDPGYPVPELPTIILFSSGLIALAGYVLLKRRR
uniref:Uncharacterized protein n=1 Tax=Candidatus Methanophagaceae archaeon ANME-1 ERB6 TaxID=2759912 RepID=A0A7G9YYY9_9EURY|nr:hypothetical protein HNLOENAD_00023 [Methanosarcinales archaeon ANME-1 ERB6]